jgi:hypothetical protein
MPSPYPTDNNTAGIGRGRDILSLCDTARERRLTITFAAKRYGGREGAKMAAHSVRTSIYLARSWRRRRFAGQPLATIWDDYTVNVIWLDAEQAWLMTVRPDTVAELDIAYEEDEATAQVAVEPLSPEVATLSLEERIALGARMLADSAEDRLDEAEVAARPRTPNTILDAQGREVGLDTVLQTLFDDEEEEEAEETA